MKCEYKEVGYVKGRYPRFRYKANCGLDVVQIEHERWNGEETIIVPMSGKCMKCRGDIEVVSSPPPTSSNSDYAAAIRVINEFSANDCRGTEIRDLWNWLCECINSSKPNHSKNSNSSTKDK